MKLVSRILQLSCVDIIVYKRFEVIQKF